MKDAHRRESYSQRHEVRNVLVVMGYEFSWGLAAAIANLATVMTGFVEWMGFPLVIVGLVPAVFWTCYSLAQPLALSVLKPGPYFFRKLILLLAIAPLGYVVMGAVVYSPEVSNVGKLVTVLGGVIFFTTLIGIADPLYMSILFETLPIHQRGRFFGARTFCFGVGGWVGGFVLGFIFAGTQAPQSFGNAFLLSGLFFILSALIFSTYRYQPPEEEAETVGASLGTQLRDLGTSVRANRSLVAFLIAEFLFFFGAMGAFPFFAGHIQRMLKADSQILVTLTQAFWASICLFGPALGWWSDRFGHRITVVISAGIFVLGTVVMLFDGCPSWLYVLGYFMASVWMPGQFVANMNLAYECARELTPAQIMVVRSVILLPTLLIGPLLVGWMLDLGFPVIGMGSCAIMMLMSGLLLQFGPRPAPQDSRIVRQS